MKINLPNMIEIGPVRSQTDCQMGTAGSAALRPSREYRECLLLAESVNRNRWA